MKNARLVAGLLMLLGACKNEEVEPNTPTTDLPKIVLNEFMASNQSTFEDSENKGDFDDWIEIYNTGDKAVNLGGLYISDNKKSKTKFKIPTTDPNKTTIQPGAYLIIWADSELEQGPLHVDFKLSAEGEDLGLYTADGQTIDEISFETQETDVSEGRLANGSGDWTTLFIPTPGTANK